MLRAVRGRWTMLANLPRDRGDKDVCNVARRTLYLTRPVVTSLLKLKIHRLLCLPDTILFTALNEGLRTKLQEMRSASQGSCWQHPVFAVVYILMLIGSTTRQGSQWQVDDSVSWIMYMTGLEQCCHDCSWLAALIALRLCPQALLQEYDEAARGQREHSEGFELGYETGTWFHQIEILLHAPHSRPCLKDYRSDQPAQSTHPFLPSA